MEKEIISIRYLGFKLSLAVIFHLDLSKSDNQLLLLVLTVKFFNTALQMFENYFTMKNLYDFGTFLIILIIVFGMGYKMIHKEQRSQIKKSSCEVKSSPFNEFRKTLFDLKTSQENCPTCLQAIEDSLFPKKIDQVPMRLDDNIAYLDSQIKMITAYINGLKDTIKVKEKTILGSRTSQSEIRAIKV